MSNVTDLVGPRGTQGVSGDVWTIFAHRVKDKPEPRPEAEVENADKLIVSMRGGHRALPVKVPKDSCILCGGKLYHFCYCRGCYLDWRYGEMALRPVRRKAHWRKMPHGLAWADADHLGIWRRTGSAWERYVPETTVMIMSRPTKANRHAAKPARPKTRVKYHEDARCCEQGCNGPVYSNDRCHDCAQRYHHLRPRDEEGRTYNQIRYELTKPTVIARVTRWQKEPRNAAKRKVIVDRYRNKPEVKEARRKQSAAYKAAHRDELNRKAREKRARLKRERQALAA